MDSDGRIVDGRFELLERIGSGGMGTVWRARDLTLDRVVALKEVRAPEGADPEAAARLRERALREARALARLNNPHVVTVHQIVDVDPYPWIVMELVDGSSLDTLLAEGTMRPSEAARIGLDVLSALRAVHACDVLHRDVKPANVLIRPDSSAVLTDFGIASVAGSVTLTATDSVIGSPEYVAPERALGHRPGPASDLWSLGVLLYVAVEGLSPFRRTNTMATLGAVLTEPPPPSRQAGALTAVIGALLVKEPERRPDAATVESMLTAALSAGLSEATTVTALVPAQGASRTKPFLVGAVVLALIAGGVTAALVLRPDKDDKPKGLGGSSASSTPASETPSPSTAPSPLNTPSPSATPQVTVTSTTTATATPPREVSPAGTWIAQLASVPFTDGNAKLNAKLKETQRSVPDAQVLSSDGYASLKPGYWVIYASGPFSDGTKALAYCRERGRTGPDACLGRYLSDVAADIKYICAPGNTAFCRKP